MQKKGTKIISTLIIALMLFSSFGVLGSASGEVTQHLSADAEISTIPMERGVIHHTPVWYEKIEPSLRKGVLEGSKDLVEITVVTTNAGALNSFARTYMTDEDILKETEKTKGNLRLTRNSDSNVPVTRTLSVPYDAIKNIAELPGIVGVYRSAKPVPEKIDNMVFRQEQERIDEMKLNGELPVPQDYTTAVEHKADVAWGMGYDGSNVNVAVVDTGIDFANPDLVGQWAVDTNPNSSYYGWPIMWDPVSMDLLLAYFTADNDWWRYPYPIFATWGESSWYSDTTYETTADYNATTDSYTVTYTLWGGFGYPNKRVDPMGWSGAVNSSFIDRTYYIGNNTTHIVSQSGIYHMGITKDDYLTSIYGTRLGILVVDSTIPGVYDTVYVDLDNDGDFTDENPVNKTNPLAYQDVDGDGAPDISGGLLYYISNTQGSVTGEVVIASAIGNETGAKLANGHIVTDIQPYYTLTPSNILYVNGSYLPFYSEPIYQDIVTDGTGVLANSTFYLNDTSIGFSTYNPVNFTYLLSQGYGITDGTLELYYGNATDEYLMTESDTPGMLNYMFDPTTGAITILFDMEPGSYIYAMYQMDTYTLDFTTGDIGFITPPPAGANITADYQYGLSVPYSDVYAERMGYDNFIPASGDLVAFFGDFDYGNTHGTLCASSVVGTWTSWVSGTAPGAKIIGIGDFYNAGGYDAWYFAVEGYDGIPGTGDEAQIVSNSFGSPTINEDGWNYASRLAYDITTNYAPETTFVVSAGNGGWGYGTVTSPGAAPGVITVGAGVNMAYR